MIFFICNDSLAILTSPAFCYKHFMTLYNFIFHYCNYGTGHFISQMSETTL